VMVCQHCEVNVMYCTYYYKLGIEEDALYRIQSWRY